MMSAAPSVETIPQVVATLPQSNSSENNGGGGGAPSDCTTTSSAGTSIIPKKDRKKLKKLKKRVSLVRDDSERSGLLTTAEWKEYQRLNNPSTITTNNTEIDVGPSIHLRKRKNGPPPVKVEGCKHRDLLAWCLKQIVQNAQDDNIADIDAVSSNSNNSNSNNSTTTKRKRNEEVDDDPIRNASIPSFVSIHNPATLTNICILEIQLSEGELESYSDIIEPTLKNMSNGGATTRCVCSIPTTKWFQGHIPRSVSDCLLYFTPNKQSKRTKINHELPPMSELLDKLLKMTISREIWEKEGYPVPCIKTEATKTDGDSSVTRINDDACPSLSRMEQIENPSSIPLNKAKTIVNSLGVRVETQSEDDNLLYVETRKVDPSSSSNDEKARVFAMDCEMVLTDIGLELARITVIQLDGLVEDKDKDTIYTTTTTILDELVKPENTVKDYLTKHSGVSAKLLEAVSIQLPQVQTALLNFLRPNDILVGHSLENDLRASRLIHPNVIDTSLIFRPARNKGTKFSLRHLSAALLKTQIQTGSHCSEEDAKAALDLATRRAWLGDTFALACENEERQSLLSSLTSLSKSSSSSSSSTTTSVCIGPAKWITNHITNTANGVHALAYDDVEECKKATVAWLKGRRKANFIWTKVTAGKNGGDGKSMNAIKSLLCDVSAIMDSSTVLLVAVQSGLREAEDMQKNRRACRDPRSTAGWPPEKEAAWKSVIDCARTGRVYWASCSSVPPAPSSS